MYAIKTKFLAPTNHRPSRIKAISDHGKVTINYDHSKNIEDNHKVAAETLAGVPISQGCSFQNGYIFIVKEHDHE